MTGGLIQISAATARNESWQPMSNRSVGLKASVTSAARASTFDIRAGRRRRMARQTTTVMLAERTTDGIGPTSTA